MSPLITMLVNEIDRISANEERTLRVYRVLVTPLL